MPPGPSAMSAMKPRIPLAQSHRAYGGHCEKADKHQETAQGNPIAPFSSLAVPWKIGSLDGMVTDSKVSIRDHGGEGGPGQNSLEEEGGGHRACCGVAGVILSFLFPFKEGKPHHVSWLPMLPGSALHE